MEEIAPWQGVPSPLMVGARPRRFDRPVWGRPAWKPSTVTPVSRRARVFINEHSGKREKCRVWRT